MERFRLATDPTGDLASMLGGPQFSDDEITVGETDVHIRIGSPAAFEVIVPRASIRAATRRPAIRGGTRGVHGRRGKWLVNRSSDDLVRLRISPPARARMSVRIDLIEGGKMPKNRLVRKFIMRMLDREIALRDLTIGVEHPDAFLRALGR